MLNTHLNITFTWSPFILESTLWTAAHPHLTGERNGDPRGLLDSHSHRQLWLKPRVPAPELTDGFLSESPDVPGWPLSADSR